MHNISRPDFAVLTEKSKLVGIGPYEPLYPDGQLRHDHIDLCVLISGKMTTWCDGLAIHNICPGQFINSVEWKSFLRVEEDQQDFGWQQQVLVEPDEDSMYLRVRVRLFSAKRGCQLVVHYCNFSRFRQRILLKSRSTAPLASGSGEGHETIIRLSVGKTAKIP